MITILNKVEFLQYAFIYKRIYINLEADIVAGHRFASLLWLP